MIPGITFTRDNTQHPTYRALAALGEACKTAFLCRYLRLPALRREIHEGLQVVENWNSVSGFIYFARGGEIASNRVDDQEVAMLCLHRTRIEETARLCDLVEASIRREIPNAEVENILDNIGMPYSTINFIYNRSGLIGGGDADILVSLKEKHRPVAEYVRALRPKLAEEFAGTTFALLPADMVSQILNFGAPAPIDIQIEGANLDGNRQLGDQLFGQLRHVPGLPDARIQQDFDYPRFHIEIDRTKAAQGGFTPRDVANSLLISLSGSFQTTPNFFLNRQNGVEYNLVAQTPQYAIQSLQEVQSMPISSPTMTRPEILADVGSLTRSTEPAVLSHFNIRRVVDIYGSVDGRDLGATGKDVARIVESNRKSFPRGTFVTVKGQFETMRTSYRGLLAGLGFAIVLVYSGHEGQYVAHPKYRESQIDKFNDGA